MLEEVIVVAQRVEENAQKVPVALSAFNGDQIDVRQIIGILDVQLNAPNVSATDANFGDRQLSIRGVGNLIEVQGRAQPSVSYHINQVPFGMPYTEFYDLERIEVLRGPQGTLYGRNSVAGTVNVMTRRPGFEGFGGALALEAGNYDLFRAKGAMDIPLSDQLAIRISGYSLDRDGYINNLADGQVPNVDGDMDGRDIYSLRITPEWRINDRTTVWLMYEHTREDDDRVRISNQICRTNPLPTTPCLPNSFGLEALNPSANGIALWAGFNGLIPLGASSADTGLQYDYPRPELGIRDQHTDLEPIFDFESDIVIGGVEHAFAQVDLSLLASYQESAYLSVQDWFMDVGYTLNPTFFNPTGQWPTSEAPRDPADPFGGPCPILNGTGGIWGGCILDADPTRAFFYDQVGRKTESWTGELKLSSRFDGPLNFLIGGQYLGNDADFSYAVGSNLYDALSVYGVPGLSSLYASMDFFAGDGALESYSAFAEVYFRPVETVKITAGLRYTHDVIEGRASAALGQSFRAPGDTGDPSAWLRFALGSWLSPTGPDATALALTDYYGITDQARAATSFPELIALLQQVPPVPTLGEAKEVFGIPDTLKTDGFTGRIVIDWQATPNALIYGSYARGRSPGGYTLNQQGQAANRFEDETVNAFEAGAKTRLLGGSLVLNAAAFYNDLNDLHVSSRPPGTIVEIANADAESWGVELESRWRVTESLDVELAYGWLETRIGDFQSLDIDNLTQSDPDLVLLRNLTDLSNFVASRSDVAAITSQAIVQGAALPVTGTFYPDGIPAWFSRDYLAANGVAVADGVIANLEGNELPTAPEHSIHIGIGYSWFWPRGTLTARWDYYWQSESYARIFNSRGDRIDSWDQHNASLTFTSTSGLWSLRTWIRNLGDEDNVTDHYLHASDGISYRNYFLTEPRVYGATLEFSFGDTPG
jgi:outer membrane receptor protein involved in Fe transport